MLLWRRRFILWMIAEVNVLGTLSVAILLVDWPPGEMLISCSMTLMFAMVYDWACKP